MDKKLSFSISSKSSSSKPNRSTLKPSHTFADNEALANDDNSSHHYITEFDNKTLTLNSSKTPKLVIPPIENEYRPGKRMKNLDLPLRSSAAGSGGELSFEVDSNADLAGEGAGANMSYGLNIRQSGKEEGAAYQGSDDRERKESIDSALLKKLKEDMNRLPEDEGFDQFEEVPVEGFGAALMAGYGWKEGMGIGRNAKQDVEVVKYKRWAGREGLGAFTDVGGTGNGNEADDGVGGRAGGGGKGERQRGRESTRESSGFTIGKEVRIIGGRHMGLRGRVVEESSSNGLLVLELSRSKEQVKASVTDVAELGSAEEEKCLKKLEELRLQDSKAANGRADKKGKDSSSVRSDKERKDSKRSREERRKDDVGYVKRDTMKREEERASRVSWLRSHIRVRIVSKEFKGGRLYLKKGQVLDVVGPTTCDISMDDNREIIQGVDQDILETALPRRGGPVIVLYGKHKGAYGSLVERDSENETGVVQDADTHEYLNVRLEQIAEYVGDPSYIGY